MGSNMQRQAVPLIRTEAPIIGTGMEYISAKDSGVVVLAKNSGSLERVTADEIVIRRDSDKEEKIIQTFEIQTIQSRNLHQSKTDCQ